jgi:acetone carboxylase gamma subunit
LGLKKIRFLLDDNEAQVAQKIMSDEVVEGETVGFPQLKDGCGFELFQCQSNCRQLTMITCCWAVKDLKANLRTQSKIYVRPIQKNLSTKKIR